MRKDKGLNGDLDRLPMLTWIMFLKFLDDLEQHARRKQSCAEEVSSRRSSRPTAGGTGRPTLKASPATSSFLHQSGRGAAAGRQGGAGLFAYLRALSSANGDNRRDVVATVFRGVDNRMKSGYLLRDVINKVAEIHFTSSDEFTRWALYESMLREMRDAAGDSGSSIPPCPWSDSWSRSQTRAWRDSA